MRQKIVILLTRMPGGHIHLPEGIRAATGITAGFDEHDVKVLFTQDGAYAAMENTDWRATDIRTHVEEFRELGGELFVDEQALQTRELSTTNVRSDVTPLTHRELTELITDADKMLSF